MSGLYLAISPFDSFGGTYGVGETIEEAKSRAKAEGGNLHRILVYAMPEGAQDPTVNNFGDILWEWAEDAPDKLARPTIVYRRGVKS